VSRRAVPRHQPPTGDAIGRWRLRHDPSSAALARRLVTQAFNSHSEPVGDQVQRRAVLATSELVANAIRHARTPLDLEIRRPSEGWLVLVTDGDGAAPRPRDAGPMSESGRGLLIVSRSSDRAGWVPTGKGKVVWFELWDERDVS
jgi:anti-sigma regulatory factor (Ser/Thr protein kinase)